MPTLEKLICGPDASRPTEPRSNANGRVATPEELAVTRKATSRKVTWGVLAFIVGGSLLMGLMAATAETSSPPATDACTRTYINDTAALARCYQLTDTGVTPSDAVELNSRHGR